MVGSILSSEQCFSGLVGLELGDLTVGWVNWHLHGVAASLVSHDLLDVDAPSLSVNANNLSVRALAAVLRTTSKNLDGVAFPDWH